MTSKYVEVAKIGRTVGLNGSVKIIMLSDFPEQFRVGVSFFLINGDTLELASYDSRSCTAIFKNYNSVNLAKKLVNSIIYSTKDETRKNCKLKDGEFFYFDIIGLEVFEDNVLLGKVVDIEHFSNFLLVVDTDESLLKAGFKDQFMIPYHDNFIVSVDLNLSRIDVKNSLSILENS